MELTGQSPTVHQDRQRGHRSRACCRHKEQGCWHPFCYQLGHYHDSPLQELLSLAGISQDCTLYYSQTRLTAFQSPKLHLRSNPSRNTSLNPRNGNVDVLLIGLRSALPCRKLTSACEASTMIESNLIPFSARPTASSSCSAFVAWSRWTEIGTEALCALLVQLDRSWHSQIKTKLQERPSTVFQSDREELKDDGRAESFCRTNKSNHRLPVVADLREDTVYEMSERTRYRRILNRLTASSFSLR